jgi:eukaryotic-like serine/threonine-protein kinase
MVRPNGTVILVDFGVARSDAVTSVTGVNSIVGTALYMAPEQVAKGVVSAATDIYALGAVAYHCILGEPPFDGDNALQVALRHLEEDPEPLPDNIAPQAVRDLISRAMAKNPADRFLSAAEFAEAAMAATGSLDWRSKTGSMTRTALVRPSTTGTQMLGPGAAAAGLGATGAMTGTRTSRRAMTGTAMTRPVSPAVGAAGATGAHTMPAQRNLLQAAPPSVPQQSPARQSRSQTIVLITVIALFLLAGGLGVAIYLSGNNEAKKQDPGVTAVVPPASEEPQTTGEPSAPEDNETYSPPEDNTDDTPTRTKDTPKQTKTTESKPAPEPSQTETTTKPPASNPPASTDPGDGDDGDGETTPPGGGEETPGSGQGGNAAAQNILPAN